MKKVYVVLLGLCLAAWSAAAQSHVGTAASGSAATDAKVAAGQQEAQVDAKASVSARQDAQVDNENKNQEGEGARSSARTRTQVSAQTEADAATPAGSASLQSGTRIEAVLSKTVEARKAKVGDQVTARTRKDVKSDGQVVIPRGSDLLGRVTHAQARGKGESESSLGIVFERARLKDGSEVPLQVAIQAVGAARSAAMAETAPPPPPPRSSGAAPSGGGLLGGVGATAGGATEVAGGVVGSATEAAGGVGSTATGALGSGAAAGSLTSESSGVVGISGLRLDSALSSQTTGQVFTSSAGNVRLESGTQLVLQVAGQP